MTTENEVRAAVAIMKVRMANNPLEGESLKKFLKITGKKDAYATWESMAVMMNEVIALLDEAEGVDALQTLEMAA